MKLVYILMAMAYLKAIIVYRVYHSMPAIEFKRRARQGDKLAARLYKVVAYEPALDLITWLAGTASAAVLIIWSARTNLWLAAVVSILITGLLTLGQFRFDGWAGRFTALFTAPHTWFLSTIQPVIAPIARMLTLSHLSPKHSRIYETKDLLDLLSRQNKQVDSRISPGDLEIARNSLTFGDKTVGSIMTPRREVVFAKADDQVGPVLVDELHQTGFSRFPVAKDSTKATTPQIVGTLYLNNLVGYNGSGKVKDLMKHEVYFINEDANLRQALGAFLKTHHHLLIVVNSFEEMVGVLTLEDVLEQILGKQIVDEFDSYDNVRAVATMHAQDEHKKHNDEHIAPEPK